MASGSAELEKRDVGGNDLYHDGRRKGGAVSSGQLSTLAAGIICSLAWRARSVQYSSVPMPFLSGYRSYRKVLLHSPGQTLDEGLFQ